MKFIVLLALGQNSTKSMLEAVSKMKSLVKSGYTSIGGVNNLFFRITKARTQLSTEIVHLS